MHASLHASVGPSSAWRCGRRVFARHCSAACLSGSICRIPAHPVKFKAAAGGLGRAQREFEALALAASALDFDANTEFINAATNQRIEYAPDPASAPGSDVWSTPAKSWRAAQVSESGTRCR